MNYAIIGAGKIGAALARIFANNGIEVAIANSRGPESLASFAAHLGPKVQPASFEDACKADIIFLAVPFSAHKDVAKQFNAWNGKIVIDVTNAFHVAPGELGDSLSTDVLATAFPGARIVKAFNHLAAAQLGTNPSQTQQRQVIFVSSNDFDAGRTIATLASLLGFAPVELGRINQGGVPLHVLNGKPGGLLLQNLAKLG